MIFLFIVGVLAAVGQHCFYSYLNGREVDEFVITQTWVIRIGIAFGYLFNYAVIAAVGIAFCHRFWFSVRRGAFSVGAIDSIFNVLDDPLQFSISTLFSKRKHYSWWRELRGLYPFPPCSALAR
jgi:hypothetical protein